MSSPTSKDLRSAQVAHVLARAVRAGEVEPTDGLRILKHELRRRDTRKSLTVPRRPLGAQASIEKYAPAPPPNNNSDDALHADHVYPLPAEVLHEVATLEGSVAELERLSAVVCVTASENYALQQIEHAGITGPEEYARAGITFTTPGSGDDPGFAAACANVASGGDGACAKARSPRLMSPVVVAQP